MIIDFTASNFRSIKEPQTISFEATDNSHLEDYYVVKKGDYSLLKMATIIGANASGKSNVLQAYQFALSRIRHSQLTLSTGSIITTTRLYSIMRW